MGYVTANKIWDEKENKIYKKFCTSLSLVHVQYTDKMVKHKHNNTRVQGQLIAAHYYPPPVDADEDYDGVFSPALWFV